MHSNMYNMSKRFKFYKYILLGSAYMNGKSFITLNIDCIFDGLRRMTVVRRLTIVTMSIQSCAHHPRTTISN